MISKHPYLELLLMMKPTAFLHRVQPTNSEQDAGAFTVWPLQQAFFGSFPA